MPLIKRYPNRKLYDTDAKRYVTLDDVTRLIQAGQEVHVVDYESGEDLTNLTLTQIILEQEKRSSSGLIPRFLLTSMIRAGGDRLAQMRRTLGAPGESGAEDSAEKPVEKGAEKTRSVTEQAGAAVEQGQQMVDQVQALLRIDERIADVLHMLNMPSARATCINCRRASTSSRPSSKRWTAGRPPAQHRPIRRTKTPPPHRKRGITAETEHSAFPRAYRAPYHFFVHDFTILTSGVARGTLVPSAHRCPHRADSVPIIASHLCHIPCVTVRTEPTVARRLLVARPPAWSALRGLRSL